MSYNGIYYKIIYHGGDPETLSVATFQDTHSSEEQEYALASRRTFVSQKEAVAYCYELAEKHGLKTKDIPLPLLD
jgi:hypothetical protein